MRTDVLMVDSGESRLAADLGKLLGQSNVVQAKLDAGDLLWYGADEAEMHGGERKRADDLMASLLDGRLLDQMERMGDRWRWLFIAGTVIPAADGRGCLAIWHDGQRWFDARYEWLADTLLKLQYWAGVGVVWCYQDIAPAVAWLWQHRHQPPKPRLVRPGVELARRNPVAAALATYENIGEEIALALAERFRTEGALAAATDAEIQMVPGVGAKRLAAIRRRLGHE